METKFRVKGFHCASCEMLVKDVAEDFPEITSCVVDVKTGEVVIKHKKSLSIVKLHEEIESVGDYEVVK
jgi:cation transport ATPase